MATRQHGWRLIGQPDRPVVDEMRYEEWTEVAGVGFPTRRANYHNGVKLAELTTEEAIRVNSGLAPQELAAKPADFAPDIPHSLQTSATWASSATACAISFTIRQSGHRF
jgi:hypothetical protein